jgi:hypothetical protein
MPLTVDTTCWVTIDNFLDSAGGTLTRVFSTDSTAIGTSTAIQARNGKAIQLTVPRAGFGFYG